MSEIEPLISNDDFYWRYINYQSLKTLFMTTTPYTVLISVAIGTEMFLNQTTDGTMVFLSSQILILMLNYGSNYYLYPDPRDFPTVRQRGIIIANVFCVCTHVLFGACLCIADQIPYGKGTDFLSRIAIVFMCYYALRIIIGSIVVKSNPMFMLAWNMKVTKLELDYETLQTDETLLEQLREETCCICTEGYNAEQLVTRLCCEHYFHTKCIKGWLAVNNTCPICRATVDEK